MSDVTLHPKFKLKKLARIQILRETELIAAMMYKVKTL